LRTAISATLFVALMATSGCGSMRRLTDQMPCPSSATPSTRIPSYWPRAQNMPTPLVPTVNPVVPFTYDPGLTILMSRACLYTTKGVQVWEVRLYADGGIPPYKFLWGRGSSDAVRRFKSPPSMDDMVWVFDSRNHVSAAFLVVI
jgi:hypothetical protein